MVELQSDAQTPQGTTTSESVTVVVFDSCHFPTPPKKVEVVLNKSDTGETLRDKIAEACGYPPDAFDIKIGQNTLEDKEKRTLEEMKLNQKFLSIYKRQGKKDDLPQDSDFKKTPAISGVYNDTQPTASSSTSSSPTSSALVPYGPALPTTTYSYPSGYSSGYSSYSWSQNSGKSSTGYIGLSNQGATCYMNSLIQTLFMTPEFRNGLYNWSFDDKYKRDTEKAQNGNVGTTPAADGAQVPNGTSNGTTNGPNGNVNANGAPFSAEEREKKERSSIPLQLQRLFARLQLCDVQAVKTKDLTKSFGWEDADAFTQHDVQELCRVLFDALEKNFQGTKQANLVNDLYQGRLKDYVQCKECKHESARIDHYLDIPLVIRGFGETVPVRSVEEALYKFIQPEILDKDNQYNCEKCGKKVDAIKGLKIEKFPYLLTLQLKRFDFDFQQMRRIKLNDRVTFPLYLDLNPIIYGKRAPTQPSQKKQEQPEDDEEEEEEEEEEGETEDPDRDQYPPDYDHDVPRSQAEEKRDYMLVDLDHEDGSVEPQKKENSFDTEPDFDAPPPIVTPELPYVYELFSVMIHRGSSMGGHYYAYIKSFETGKWYEFNDSVVSEITVQEVKKAFGGDEDGGYSSLPRNIYTSSFRSNANAYMLMYRQMDPTRNKKPIVSAEIPEALKKVIEEENGAAKQKKKAEEMEREMIKMKIYYNGEDKSLSMHKTATLNDTAKASANLFGISDKYTPGNYRLRGYSHYNDLPGDTYTGKESKSLDELNFYMGTLQTLLLETKEDNEEFDEYNSALMLFRVAKYNPATSDFEPAVKVYVNKSGTLIDLREAIEQKLGVPKDKQNIFKEASQYSSWNSPPASLISKPDETDIRHLHFQEPEKLYVEYTLTPMTKEEEEKTESPVVAALERIKNVIKVKFNLPGKDEFDQKVNVDKNMLVKKFKEQIAPIVGLSVDEFKIKRGSTPHLYELTNETESLSECSIRDGMSLTIEKGRPLKEGETNYMFEFLDLTKDSDNFTELFEIPVHEDMLIMDLKNLIFPKLQEKGINVKQPDHIRLRDVSSSQYSRRVGKVFPDAITVKKATLYVYSKKIAVQLLNEPEQVQNPDKDLCFFVQKFTPSTFELSKKEDFVISEDASLEEFREKLGLKYDITPANVGILRIDTYYSFYDDPDLLEIPDMNWDKPTVAYSTKNTVGDTMMMRNGNLIVCRDNTEKLKELTKEEKDAIKKEASRRKANDGIASSSYSYWNRKERALKIHTAE